MISLGADPEWFIKVKSGRYAYHVTPCVGLIPGTKQEPHSLGDGFGVHEDNVVVELTVPVTHTPQDFADIIQIGKKLLKEQYINSLEAKLHYSASAFFTIDELDSKQAQAFGCEPDFDAYRNGAERQTPRRVIQGQSRYAGGHIHLGGDFNCPPFVTALFCDLFIGVSERWVNEHSNSWISEYNGLHDRAAWYGAPGIFRPKPYGIEYRTPTNHWTKAHVLSSQMGDNMWRCAHWLQSTTATDIRKALKEIDWLRIRKLLTSHELDRTVVATECSQIIQAAQKWCSV